MTAGPEKSKGGRPRAWKTPGPTTRFRVPVALLLPIRDLAQQLDDGGKVLYDRDSNDAAVRDALAILTVELDLIAADRKRTTRQSAIKRAVMALEHYQGRRGAQDLSQGFGTKPEEKQE